MTLNEMYKVSAVLFVISVVLTTIFAVAFGATASVVGQFVVAIIVSAVILFTMVTVIFKIVER